MRFIGNLASLLLSTMLCIIELYKIEAVLDVESRRASSYNACDRILRLVNVEFKLLVLMIAAQVLSLSYASFLVVLMFVYEVQKKGSDTTISALDFFKQKRWIKIEMFCKTSFYVFLLYRYFSELVVNKS
ncbi:cornichon protein [Encephalitozoon hellem]|nr:cornichon protein [Encephalitozoon hellem]